MGKGDKHLSIYQTACHRLDAALARKGHHCPFGAQSLQHSAVCASLKQRQKEKRAKKFRT